MERSKENTTHYMHGHLDRFSGKLQLYTPLEPLAHSLQIIGEGAQQGGNGHTQ